MSLSAVVCRAERQLFATHDIHDMVTAGTMACVKPFTTATTAELTYTCSGTGAQFGSSGEYIALLLPNNESQVVITPAIEDLVGIQILHYLSTAVIEMCVSEDGEHWGKPLSGDAFKCGSSGIEATVPRGTYAIMIKNTVNSTSYAIRRISYYTEPCHCLRYRIE